MSEKFSKEKGRGKEDPESFRLISLINTRKILDHFISMDSSRTNLRLIVSFEQTISLSDDRSRCSIP